MALNLTQEFLRGAQANAALDGVARDSLGGHFKKVISSLSQSELDAADEEQYNNVATERYVVEADEIGIDSASLRRSGFSIKVEKTRMSGKVAADHLEKHERSRQIRRSLD